MHADATQIAHEAQAPARLEREGESRAVVVTAASRISLFVRFPSGEAPPADRTVFQKLTVDLRDGRKAELSTCRFHLEHPWRGASGRLVFLDDVYDCHALLGDGKLVNLKAFFQNLPLVISQKEKIRPAFREYVGSAMYDLSVYKKFFNEQDRILSGEPPQVADAAREALLRTEGRAFFRFFDRQLEELSRLVDGFEKEEHERHGFYFRRHAWEYILGSEFLKRTNLKPRGYAGDAEMMVLAYQNDFVGNYVFNKLLHKHPLETPAAQAVRNRRGLIPHVLREVGRQYPSGAVNVLSVACGPAAEMEDVFVSPEDFERFRVTLLDQDPEALEFARGSVAKAENARGGKVKARYMTDSVRTMLRTRDLSQRFGRMHFIYSMGLFDYLTTPVARALLSRLYEIVEPGGSLLVGNFHVGNPTRHYMAYWMDWVLYYRSEDEFLDLAARLPGGRAAVSFDASGAQMFLRVDKER